MDENLATVCNDGFNISIWLFSAQCFAPLHFDNDRNFWSHDSNNMLHTGKTTTQNLHYSLKTNNSLQIHFFKVQRSKYYLTELVNLSSTCIIDTSVLFSGLYVTLKMQADSTDTH